MTQGPCSGRATGLKGEGGTGDGQQSRQAGRSSGKPRAKVGERHRLQGTASSGAQGGGKALPPTGPRWGKGTASGAKRLAGAEALCPQARTHLSQPWGA